MSRHFALALSLVVLGLGLGLAAPSAHAASIQFDIFLDGLQEVPPVATPGTGLGTLTLDDATGDYTISGTFADLIGTSNNAHIHGPATYGVNGGVVVGLTYDVGVGSGTFSGAGTFTAPQMADLLNELYYVNIHSTFKVGGEIRGQIVQAVPEPGSLALLSLGGLLMSLGARRSARRRMSAARSSARRSQGSRSE